jgi:S-adenosylmethionine decarboxylase
MRPRSPSGRHWIVEFRGASSLEDLRAIRLALKNAATLSGAKLLKVQLHHFGAGAGVTGVALLAESHISVHTWPERAYAAIDIFMCGSHCSPALALSSLRADLKPKQVLVRRLIRKMPVLRRKLRMTRQEKQPLIDSGLLSKGSAAT